MSVKVLQSEAEGGGRAPSALQSNSIPTNDSYELCTQTLTTEVAKQWFSDDQGNIIMIYVGKIKQQDVSDAALHFTKFNLDSFY